MMIVAAALGGLGLVCMLFRKTLLGILIGIQLLVLAAALIFVLSGSSSEIRVQGHVLGMFIIVSGVAQAVIGYAVALRLFFLKKRAGMAEVKSLKH